MFKFKVIPVPYRKVIINILFEATFEKKSIYSINLGYYQLVGMVFGTYCTGTVKFNNLLKEYRYGYAQLGTSLLRLLSPLDWLNF